MATKKPGTAVAVKKTTGSNIVDIQALLRKEVESMADRVGAPGGDAIRITQDKKFELPDGTKSQGPVQLVIVDFISVNTFYEGDYDKDSITPPACYAAGDKPTTLAPLKNSPARQADNCATCPMNQWGSSGKGKACKNTRLLAVLPANATAETPLMVLKVSPTGLKSFDAYVTSVTRSFQVPPVGVITEVSFDDNVTYASLRFGNPEPNENVAVHFARRDEARARLMAEPDFSQYEAPAPVKKAVAAPRRR